MIPRDCSRGAVWEVSGWEFDAALHAFIRCERDDARPRSGLAVWFSSFRAVAIRVLRLIVEVHPNSGLGRNGLEARQPSHRTVISRPFRGAKRIQDYDWRLLTYTSKNMFSDASRDN
jgi:hypothetical protein